VSHLPRRIGALAASATLAVLLSACSASASPTGSVDCVAPVNGVLTLTAADREFDAACLGLPAGESVTIRLVNDDVEPHNLAIYTDSGRATQIFSGDIIEAGETIDYELDPLEAGTFFFECTVHPEMTGSVVVE
jgi:plastocyanin